MMPIDKDWIDVLTAFGPVIIGLAVAWVAFQQMVTNKRRLKSELFDERYKVYLATTRYLGSILTDGVANVRVGDKYQPFLQEALKAPFLFDDELASWIKEIRNRSHEFWVFENSPKVTPEENDKCAENFRWLLKQHGNVEKKFQKYLFLSH